MQSGACIARAVRRGDEQHVHVAHWREGQQHRLKHPRNQPQHLFLLLVLGCCGGRLLHVCGDEVARAVLQRRRRLVQRGLAPLLGRRLGGCVGWVKQLGC